MALAIANLETAIDNSGPTSTTTGSLAPPVSSLVIANVYTQLNGGVPATPTITGGGVGTWTQHTTRRSGSDTDARMTTLYGLRTGVGATATIDYGGVAQTRTSYSIFYFTGGKLTGTNGIDGIVQVAMNDASAASLTVTLAAFADAVNNMAIGTFNPRDTGVQTAGSGFTILAQAQGGSNGNDIMTEYKTGEDTSVDASGWAAATVIGVAMEMAVAGGAVVVTSPFYYLRRRKLGLN